MKLLLDTHVLLWWLDDDPRLPEFGFGLLDLANSHLLALRHLPHHHGDPFDHLLLAQAHVERACLISSAKVLQQYGIACIPA